MPRKKSKRGRHRLRQEQKSSSPTASQALSRGAVNTPVTACKPSMPGFFTPKCFSVSAQPSFVTGMQIFILSLATLLL